MAHEDYKVPKLNGDNFHAWSIRARATLVQKRCWDAIEPGFGLEMTADERRKNEEALTLLFLIVEDTYLDDIGDCLRASDAWEILKQINTKFGLLHILQLMKDFFNIQKKPSENVKSYLGRLMDIHRKLNSAGYAFTDREVALVMLIGLPKSYEPLILNLEKDEENLSTMLVKARLTVEEKRLSRTEVSQNLIEEEKALKSHYAKNPNIKFQKKLPMDKNKENLKPPADLANAKRNTRCFSCGNGAMLRKTVLKQKEEE